MNCARFARLTLVVLTAIAVAAAASGCSLSSTVVPPGSLPVPAEPANSIDTIVLLIGDAGLPDLENPERVLEVLQAEASQHPEKTAVVFLGDNIYPDGLRAPDGNKREQDEAALLAQIHAVRAAGARGIFVPGNHDTYSGGTVALRRQAEFIREHGGSRIVYGPTAGCPGPETVDVGERARIVLLDSQWWLDERAVPEGTCAINTREEIVGALREALATAGDRHAIVVAHHPMRTHGWHGGHADWRDHLFPLSRVSSVLWIPLPGIGSLYPLWRRSGRVKQDIFSARYERMIEDLRKSFGPVPPLMHAAGHDHNLQLFGPDAAHPWTLVSGAGSIERVDPVGHGDDNIVVSPFAGFFRLDLLHDGRVRLELIEVHEDGRVERPWSDWLHHDASSN